MLELWARLPNCDVNKLELGILYLPRVFSVFCQCFVVVRMSASPSNSQDPTQFLYWSVEDVLGWLACLPLSQDYSTLFQGTFLLL